MVGGRSLPPEKSPSTGGHCSLHVPSCVRVSTLTHLRRYFTYWSYSFLPRSAVRRAHVGFTATADKSQTVSSY
jgi:hypothetical protein